MNAVSDEQQIIIDHVSQGKNVVVDACAGSGKSTTILSAAKSLPSKKFLLITYNKSLRKEIQEKVQELQLKNVNVHTYHSLCVATYDSNAYIDKVMRLLIQQNVPPQCSLSPVDIVVLDEVQDMTFLYFKLVIKYITDMNVPIQLMVLGDYMQGLYEFKGADIRFLTLAGELWSGFRFLKTQDFVACSLRTSYRITNPMADFVNHSMLGDTRLLACRDGDPVCYIRRKIYDLERFVVHTIRDLIENYGAQPADIFVLGGSVKGPNSMIRRIENALVDANIPCHVPMMETSENIDEDVIKGKIVFSSFHTSKGRQRPYVFVVGFDHSYFKTIARNMDATVCPNTLYVATTRASKRMFLLESDEWSSDRPFKFLKMTHNEMRTKPYIDFRGIPRVLFEEDKQINKSDEICHKVNPTDLTKFISEAVLEEITQILDTVFIKENDNTEHIELPSMIKTAAGFFEDVSDLNGIAIPAILYDYIAHMYRDDDELPQCILYDMIVESMSHSKPNKHLFLKRVIRELSPICENLEDYLYMANVYEATQEKLYFKLKQIDRAEYTWLTPAVLRQCKRRIMEVLEKEILESEPKVEETIIRYDDEYENGRLNDCLSPYLKDSFAFCARIDLLTENTLWELKCTSDITAEHMIQTIVYAWIMRTVNPNFSKSVKIFNIRTGQVMRLDAEKSVLDTIVVALLKGKYEETPPTTAEDFLTECKKITENTST